MLKLSHGLSFPDLYTRDGLVRVDAAFLAALARADDALCQQLRAAREQPSVLTNKQESELLIALASHLDDFIAELFGIEAEVRALSARHHELAPLFSCKRLFVQRKALHKYKAEAAAAIDGAQLRTQLSALFGGEFTELAFAQHVTRWQENEAAHAAELDLALQYAAWATQTPAGKAAHRAGVLFKAPHKLNYQHLVPLVADDAAGYTAFTTDPAHLRRRAGFKLTDPGTDLTGALD
ncbi:MAG TPA: hypothetical protein VEW70_05220 [Burkholderiales bacterium]|nr:hypothetical protein [Burkholderiales bacterium]